MGLCLIAAADPFLVTRVVHMLDCANYIVGPESELSLQRYDYAIDCNSSQYTIVKYTAWLMLFCYPLGIPAFAFWVFHKNRKRLLDRSHHRHSLGDQDELSAGEDRTATDKTSIWALLGTNAVKSKPWWYGNRDTFYFMVRDYKPKYYYFVRTPPNNLLCSR